MAASLAGKWDFVSSDNLDDYMAASGVAEDSREEFKGIGNWELANSASLEISNDGDNWSIKSLVSGEVNVSNFRVGEEFDKTGYEDQVLTCTVVLEGDKMVETQKVNGVTITNTREVVGDELVATMTVNDVSATMKYKKN